MLGEGRPGRDLEEQEEPADDLGRRRDEGVERAHDGGRRLHRPQRRPGQHVADLLQRERERHDDADVAAAAAQRPEQVGLLGLARAHEPAVGEHHVGRDQVVDRQAASAGEVAESPAEGDAADAGRGDDAARQREAERMGRVVDVAEQRAAEHARDLRHRVDDHAAHAREVDDEPVVDAAQARAVVSAAADRQRQALAARVPDGGDHVGRVGTAGDQRRPAIDHRVVERATLVVVGVAWRGEGAAHGGLQGGRGEAGHAVPPGQGEARG
jgi:hypothetical protein